MSSIDVSLFLSFKMALNDFGFTNQKSFALRLNDLYRSTMDDQLLPPRTKRLFTKLVETFYFKKANKSQHFVLKKLFTPEEAAQLKAIYPMDGPRIMDITFDRDAVGLDPKPFQRTHQILYVTPNTDLPPLNPDEYGGFRKNIVLPDCLMEVLKAFELLSPPELFGGRKIRANYYQNLYSFPRCEAQIGFHVDSHRQHIQPCFFPQAVAIGPDLSHYWS